MNHIKYRNTHALKFVVLKLPTIYSPQDLRFGINQIIYKSPEFILFEAFRA